MRAIDATYQGDMGRVGRGRNLHRWRRHWKSFSLLYTCIFETLWCFAS